MAVNRIILECFDCMRKCSILSIIWMQSKMNGLNENYLKNNLKLNYHSTLKQSKFGRVIYFACFAEIQEIPELLACLHPSGEKHIFFILMVNMKFSTN